MGAGCRVRDDNAALKNNNRPIPMMMESRTGFFIIFGKYITADSYLNYLYMYLHIFLQYNARVAGMDSAMYEADDLTLAS